MVDSTSSGFGGGPSLPWLLLNDKRSSSERAMSVERAIAENESTATLGHHVSMACSRTGNMHVGTRGVLAGGRAVASSIRIGRSMVPMTPLWSKKEVERVMVSPIRSERCRGFQMARRSMHVAKQGWCGGVKVRVSSPFHLIKGRAWTWASFGVLLV